LLSRLTSSATPVQENLPERVPTLGRVQYLIQEQFDIYGGRFFHFRVPPVSLYLEARKPKVDQKSKDGRKTSVTDTSAAANTAPPTVSELQQRNADYIAFIKEHLKTYVHESLQAICPPKATPQQYYDSLSALSAAVGGFTSGLGQYDAGIRSDFDDKSDEFHKLRVIDMGQCATDLLYALWAGRSGDNGMVKYWSTLGFVVQWSLPPPDAPATARSSANVETERSRLDGMQYRDYYYMLCNIDDFPENTAKKL
jgi:hypothetical protein